MNGELADGDGVAGGVDWLFFESPDSAMLFVDLELPVYLTKWAGASRYEGQGPFAVRATPKNFHDLRKEIDEEPDQQWLFCLRVENCNGSDHVLKKLPSG